MKPAASSYGLTEPTKFSHRKYWALAFPLIISGISTPIIGAVDTAVVGRLPDPSAIGGVAIGAVIFNTMYWLLGFLRVSTSGFTAQAVGAENENETMLSLYRPILIALIFGLFFIMFQKPILHIALFLFGGGEAVSSFAASYFTIRIWGAPFILLSYVFIGWMMGKGQVGLTLATQIAMNLLNILLSILFVLGFEMGVEGVAYATLIAEISAVLFGGWFIIRTNRGRVSPITWRMMVESQPLIRMLKINRDLFLRTVCLLIMTGIFTAQGAKMGEVTLAANAILLQIHYIMAYLIGGFANASSIIVGKSIGGNNPFLFKRACQLSAQWGFCTALLLSMGMLLSGEAMVGLFTTIEEVRSAVNDYLLWMVLYPIAGFWGLQLEGIFSGAIDAKSIRDSISFALILFLVAIWLLVPAFHNHGVWMAFLLFSLARSIFLSLYIPQLNQSIFLRNK